MMYITAKDHLQFNPEMIADYVFEFCICIEHDSRVLEPCGTENIYSSYNYKFYIFNSHNNVRRNSFKAP